MLKVVKINASTLCLFLNKTVAKCYLESTRVQQMALWVFLSTPTHY